METVRNRKEERGKLQERGGEREKERNSRIEKK